MTTGARRGEMCAVREDDLDLTEGREVIWLRRAIRKNENGRLTEAELKTHQQRRIALDPETVLVLREHLDRWNARLQLLGKRLTGRTYLFSGEPDGSTWPKPDSVSQRYDRLAARLDIATTFHKLRHYTATELITAGVDVRTVAGRLGHGGGGTTTLRTYTAWVSEADQRAAAGLGAGMPTRPTEYDRTERQQTKPRTPYEFLAGELRRQILAGDLAEGDRLPTEQELIAEHKVSVSTVRRAKSLLREWGVLGDSQRYVSAPPRPAAVDADVSTDCQESAAEAATQYWSVTLRGPNGHRYPARLVRANLDDPDSFKPHLLGIAQMEVPEHVNCEPSWIDDYELEVRAPGAAAEMPASATLRWAMTG
jgi:DNA-binding transcriptional regulator YhcF (GntR family)